MNNVNFDDELIINIIERERINTCKILKIPNLLLK